MSYVWGNDILWYSRKKKSKAVKSPQFPARIKWCWRGRLTHLPSDAFTSPTHTPSTSLSSVKSPTAQRPFDQAWGDITPLTKAPTPPSSWAVILTGPTNMDAILFQGVSTSKQPFLFRLPRRCPSSGSRLFLRVTPILWVQKALTCASLGPPPTESGLWAQLKDSVPG